MMKTNDDILDRLASIVARAKKRGASDCEAVAHVAESDEITLRNGLCEEVTHSTHRTLSVRSFMGHKQSLVTVDWAENADIDDILDHSIAIAQDAIDDPSTALLPSDKVQPAPDESALESWDETPVPYSLLEEWARRMEEKALMHKGVTKSDGASMAHGRGFHYLYSSNGHHYAHRSSMSSGSISLLAGTDEAMESDYASCSRRFWADMRSPEAIAEEAAMRVTRRCNATKIPSGKLPIILDPRCARRFIASLAGTLNGHAIAHKQSLFEGKLGTIIANSGITLWDNPHITRGFASTMIDDEGICPYPRAMIDKGRLSSYFLDHYAATKLNLTHTGHGSRPLGGKPLASATNLSLAPGDDTPASLIGSIKKGIYVTDGFGSGLNRMTGDYSQGISGLMIEEGELTYPVNEITMASTLHSMLETLTPANDVAWESSVASPSLRIDNMMIAGT